MDLQQPLPNTCACADEVDNGVAATWALTLDPGQSVVRSSEFSLRRVA